MIYTPILDVVVEFTQSFVEYQTFSMRLPYNIFDLIFRFSLWLFFFFDL